MSPRASELSFSRLDGIFINSTPTYTQYLVACVNSMIEGKTELINCLSQQEIDAFSRVRHKLQPNLELMGLSQLKTELAAIEKNPSLLNTDRIFELTQDIDAIIDLIDRKIKALGN